MYSGETNDTIKTITIRNNEIILGNVRYCFNIFGIFKLLDFHSKN